MNFGNCFKSTREKFNSNLDEKSNLGKVVL